eukprot:6125690-Prymnesium_polylepis.1
MPPQPEGRMRPNVSRFVRHAVGPRGGAGSINIELSVGSRSRASCVRPVGLWHENQALRRAAPNSRRRWAVPPSPCARASRRRSVVLWGGDN